MFNSLQLGLIRISSFLERLSVKNKLLLVQSFIYFECDSILVEAVVQEDCITKYVHITKSILTL